MTRKTYCGNLLWQSGLTLLAPDLRGSIEAAMPRRGSLLYTAFTTVCVATAAFSPSFGVNPITPEGEFFSDPAPRTGPDGALYLFGSRDELSASGVYCSRFNDVFETHDLRSWKIRRGVLASVGENDGIPASDAQLYAPDAIFHNGKWRIFYCMPDKSHSEGVASADTVAGPFETMFAYDWARQIDPSIFRDDDGTLYYFWGQFSAKGAVLKPDLSGVHPGTLHEGVIDEARHNFHEGIQLTKRGGMYYLVFADVARRGRPTCIGYATSDKPFGPYVYRGVIVDNFGCDPETWNNHGGIVEYGGKWYVVYHRATNASRSMRKACVEPIEFTDDGSISEVEMTSNGAGPMLDAFSETPARLACVMSGRVRIETSADGRERLSQIRSGDSATWRYFDMSSAASRLALCVVPRKGGIIELRDGKGASYGRVAVSAGDGKTEQTIAMTLTRPFPVGRCAVTLGFHGGAGAYGGRGDVNLFDVISFQFCDQQRVILRKHIERMLK